MEFSFQRVLQRLVYERLIEDPQVTPKRLRVSLEDVLKAGEQDSRVLIVLPAILMFKPKILHKLYKDLEKFPEIVEFTRALFSPYSPKKFRGIPVEIFQKAARDYKTYLDQKKSKATSIVRTFRFTKNDIDLLEKLTEILGTTGMSQTLRLLIREKASVVGISDSVNPFTPVQSPSTGTHPGWRLGARPHPSSVSERPCDR